MLAKLRPRPIQRRRLVRPGHVCAHTLDSFDACDGWPKLGLASSPAPTLGWLRAARTAFAETDDLAIFLSECGDEPLTATALVGRRQGLCWYWSPPGAQLGEPVDVAGSDPRGLAALARSLVRFGQPIYWPRLPAGAALISAVRRAARGRAVAIVRSAAASPAWQLDESWSRPERKLPENARKLLTRCGRQAERNGPLSIDIRAPNLRELPDLLDGWCQATRVPADDAAALHLGRVVFLRHYAESACIEGTLRVGQLKIGDRLAAVQLAVDSGDALWILEASEDARFEACRPGHLLAREMLHYAAEANLTSVELWGSEQPWTRLWPVVERPCVSVRLYPLNTAGAVAMASDAATHVWQHLRSAASAGPLPY